MPKSQNNVHAPEPIPFSSGKKPFTVLFSYLGAALLLSLFFLPIFGTVETDEIDGRKFYASASCSIFQILTQDTIADIKVYGGSAEENDFLSALLGSADVIEDSLFTEDWGMMAYYVFSGTVVVAFGATLIVTYPLSFGLPKRKSFPSDKDFEAAALSAETERIYDQLYGTRIPKILGMILLLLFFGIGFVTAIGFLFSAQSGFNFRHNIDIIRLVLSVVIAIFGMSLASGTTFAKKEYAAISKYHFLYDPAQQVLRPRTDEEMLSLYKDAFGEYYSQSKTVQELEARIAEKTKPNASTATGEESNLANSTSATGMSELESLRLLKTYKELLDSGIISQEEFEEKKQELLNKKD